MPENQVGKNSQAGTLGTIQTITKKVMCDKHGEYEATGSELYGHTFWTGCEKCIQEAKDEIAKEEQEKKEVERIKYLESRGIRKRFYYTTFDTYIADTKEKKNALDVCRDFIARESEVFEKGECLFLIGKPGTGKNHLAVSIVRETRSNARIVKASEMIRRIRESYRHESRDTEQELIEEFASIPLLVINEVGVQFGTDAEKNLLFEVLDIRYENMLPTVFISNLSIQGIRDFVGGRVIDRMLENGQVVEFMWESYRKK